MDTRKVPYYKSGIRHNLYLGCDRTLIVSLLGLCVCLVWVYMFVWWADLLAVALFTGGQFWLRRIAKFDPLAFRVYLTGLLFSRVYTRSGYYPARGNSLGKAPGTPKKWVM